MDIAVISNPASGGFDKALICKCASILESRLGRAYVMETANPADAAKFATEFDGNMIVAAGGDGLINGVVRGIIEKPKPIVFSALPFGSANVFCREYKIPLNPIRAAERMCPHNVAPIPLGFFDDRPFVMWAGFGFDASIVQGVETRGYRRNKRLAHVIEGVGALDATYPNLKLKVRLESGGIDINAKHAIVSVAKFYAGSFPLSDDIRKGNLNVLAPKRDWGIAGMMARSLSLVTGRGFVRDVEHCQEMSIQGANRVQIDGDYMEIDPGWHTIGISNPGIWMAQCERRQRPRE